MKYAVVSMAQRRLISESNPQGWTDYGHDHDHLLDRVNRLPNDVRGVTLQRACGATRTGVVVGTRPDGTLIRVMPESPSRVSYPTDLIRRIRETGRSVFAFAGWPLDREGFAALRDLATTPGVQVGVDSSGQAVNGSLVARLGAVVEPAPMPTMTPDWFGLFSQPVFTMVGRARTLEALGVLPPQAMIGWNGDEDGHSYYDADEVRHYAKLGHDVHIPIRFLREEPADD